jgi:RHS repeat-associated protein
MARRGPREIRVSNRLIRIAALLGLSVLANASYAESSYPFQEYGNQVEAAKTVGPLGAGAFGESTSDYSGATQFTAVDIDLPGNNALPVRLGRRFVIEDRYGSNYLAGFGEWDVEVPYIVGTFPANSGWVAGAGGSSQRCSTALPPYFSSAYFVLEEVWNGNTIHIPGEGDRQLLASENGKYGVADRTTQPWITDQMDRVGCTADGQGFVVTTTSGVKYVFNLMVERSMRGLRKGPTYAYTLDRKRVYLLATKVEDRFGNVVNYHYTDGRLQSIVASDGRRIDLDFPGGAIASATAAGRTWNYSYSPSGQLAAVANPDGSKWGFASVGELRTYALQAGDIDPFGSSETLDCLANAPDGGGGGFVYTVSHPSGATGKFVFASTRHFRTEVPYGCIEDVAPHQVEVGSTVDQGITQYDNALYQAMVDAIKPDATPAERERLTQKAWDASHTSYTTSTTLTQSIQVGGYVRLAVPNHFDTFALLSSQVSGAGLELATTSFDYGYVTPLGFCDDEGNCDVLCLPAHPCDDPGSKWVTISHPDHTQTRRRYGVRYGKTEGQLLQEQVLAADGTVLRNTDFGYVSDDTIASQPFPSHVGASQTPDPMVGKVRPRNATIITQQGVDFSSMVTGFDAFARPLTLTRASTLGYTRNDAIEYHDNLASWVLGQVSRSIKGGSEESRTAFNAQALPAQTYRFSLLQDTLTYNADGTLASVTDGKGNATALSDWYRGVPRTIAWADGTSSKALVNDSGWITETTDQLLSKTVYGHDALGRLNLIDYPTESVAWNNTTRDFIPVASAEYGIPAGHWKQTVQTGGGLATTYFNALWQPVLILTEDISAPSSRSYVVNRYDIEGRLVFTSYPVAALTTVNDTLTGVRTEYDALGRATKVIQDSELGPLETTTEYLTGFVTQVTNPKGTRTRTSFQAFDAPSTDAPASIVAGYGLPDQQTTTISRSVLGIPLSLTRSGTYDGAAISATRRYVYDAYKRLCKTIEPETGTTVVAWDLAGNLAWSASGQNYPSLTACERASVPVADLTVRSYDAMNRLTRIDVPNSSNDPTYAYFPDGALKKLVNGGATWDYTYNLRRLPETEKLTQGTKVRTLTHLYNVNGHETTTTYPSGYTFSLLPNALGQATRTGTLATGATYYPNGAMSGYVSGACNAGDCLVHSMTRNSRGLPSLVRAKRAGAAATLEDATTYDANGNVISITDTSSVGGGSRTMAYDPLDRLVRADAPNQNWIYAVTSYDPLDNIRSNQVGMRLWSYGYDNNPTTGKNRLVSLQKMDGTSTVNHDANGNLTGIVAPDGKVASYSFDAMNRLLQAQGKENYEYDGHGRRVKIQRISDGKSAYPFYSLDGRLITEEDERTLTYTDYFYLNGSLVAKRSKPIGTSTWTTKYVFTDALGSPVLETDALANVIKTEKYTPYGEPSDGGHDQGPGYTGHVTDSATGLSYMQQRYYDPALGRFLSVDPMASDRQSGWNFNRYNYVAGNPYRYTDPDGRKLVIDPAAPAEYRDPALANFKALEVMELGRAMIQLLDASPHRFIVFPDPKLENSQTVPLDAAGELNPDGSPGAGSGGAMAYNPHYLPDIWTSGGLEKADPRDVLFHELGHFYAFLLGIADPTIDPATGATREEARAIAMENQLRNSRNAKSRIGHALPPEDERTLKPVLSKDPQMKTIDRGGSNNR